MRYNSLCVFNIRGTTIAHSAGPRAWNSLPSSLQELTDSKTFKRKLKTFLFQQAYNLYVVFILWFYFYFYLRLCNPLVNSIL